MTDINQIRDNIEAISKTIPDGVEILAAAKTRTSEEVKAAMDAGISLFGHNYVQEAEEMIHGLDVKAEWHIIGHLQRNKAGQAVELFDMIESVDSLRLAKELEKRCGQIGKVMPVLIEVNSGREENKTGVLPENCVDLAGYLNTCKHLKLKGLMTMGPLTGDPELSRPYYKETRRLYEEIASIAMDNVEMKVLSMGMSNSYRVAIDEGANLVRLGTIIFGPRVA
jgi:pyridoxal phosphate enzyme (YggS family)